MPRGRAAFAMAVDSSSFLYFFGGWRKVFMNPFIFRHDQTTEAALTGAQAGRRVVNAEAGATNNLIRRAYVPPTWASSH